MRPADAARLFLAVLALALVVFEVVMVGPAAFAAASAGFSAGIVAGWYLAGPARTEGAGR